MNYKHTAADALHFAEMCKIAAEDDIGILLTPESVDLVSKMAEFWAEHNKFNVDDVVEHNSSHVFAVSSARVASVYTETKLIIEFERADGTKTTVESSQEFYNLVAGHRIDEVQDD